MEKRGRGRPKVSSMETMAEAAVELFLEIGFEEASIDAIAARVGVSRGSVFTYLPGGKSDALWYFLQPTIDAIVPEAGAGKSEPVRECIEALVAAVEPWGDSVPQVIRDAELMRAREVLLGSGGERLEDAAERLAAHIALAEGSLPESPRPATISRALVGAALGALHGWVQNPVTDAASAVRDGIEPLIAYESK